MFIKFPLHLLELLKVPYYNQFASENIGEVKKKYYGGKKK